MSPQTASLVRYWVLFWIVVPLLADAVCFALIYINGAMILLWVYGSFAAAHMIVTASFAGLLGIIFGLRPDWKLLAAIAVGLGCGLWVLCTIYL